LRVRTERGQHPDQVVQAILRTIHRWRADPRTRILASACLAPFTQEPRENVGSWVPRALHEWTQTISHTREPAGDGAAGEIVQSPPLTVALGSGDCDDIAAAVGTFAAAYGHKVWIGYTRPGPGFAHVIAAISTDSYRPSAPMVAIDPDQRIGPTHPPRASWAVL
jgi:hypothetical protein